MDEATDEYGHFVDIKPDSLPAGFFADVCTHFSERDERISNANPPSSRSSILLSENALGVKRKAAVLGNLTNNNEAWQDRVRLRSRRRDEAVNSKFIYNAQERPEAYEIIRSLASSSNPVLSLSG